MHNRTFMFKDMIAQRNRKPQFEEFVMHAMIFEKRKPSKLYFIIITIIFITLTLARSEFRRHYYSMHLLANQITNMQNANIKK